MSLQHLIVHSGWLCCWLAWKCSNGSANGNLGSCPVLTAKRDLSAEQLQPALPELAASLCRRIHRAYWCFLPASHDSCALPLYSTLPVWQVLRSQAMGSIVVLCLRSTGMGRTAKKECIHCYRLNSMRLSLTKHSVLQSTH